MALSTMFGLYCFENLYGLKQVTACEKYTDTIFNKNVQGHAYANCQQRSNYSILKEHVMRVCAIYLYYFFIPTLFEEKAGIL